MEARKVPRSFTEGCGGGHGHTRAPGSGHETGHITGDDFNGHIEGWGGLTVGDGGTVF